MTLWLAGVPGAPAFAQAPVQPPPAPEFRLGGELKLGFRDSRFVQVPLNFPTPGNFHRSVHAGRSLELQYAALIGEGEIVSGLHGRVEVRFLDLYNRNPTSSDDRVLLREAWVAFGEKPAPLEAPRSRAYLLAGLAPRFTKQLLRRLESYGLAGTAVGRFEQPQLQLGIALGPHLYLRGQVGNGNPLFFRDPNALAGENDVALPEYQTGFPILYDAKPADLNLRGEFEWGAGLGARVGGGERAGVDALGFYFRRRLAERVRIRGSSLPGDLELLRGGGFPLPFKGDSKREWGVNLNARAGGLRAFGQYLDQDIAGLGRTGVELEVGWVQQLDGLFLVKESPFGNWIQPVVRFSRFDNDFAAPPRFTRLSVQWDWSKWDFGLRFGLVRNADLTVEYARHKVVRAAGNIHPNELLVTLRVGY